MLECDDLCTLGHFKDGGRIIACYTEQHPVFERISEVGNYPIYAMFERKIAHEYADALHVSITRVEATLKFYICSCLSHNTPKRHFRLIDDTVRRELPHNGFNTQQMKSEAALWLLNAKGARWLEAVSR